MSKINFPPDVDIDRYNEMNEWPKFKHGTKF